MRRPPWPTSNCTATSRPTRSARAWSTADPAMIRFSASDAALEGFQMLRTHWRVVVGWGLFNLLALVAMVVVTVILGVGIGVAAGLDEASGAAGVIGGV